MRLVLLILCVALFKNPNDSELALFQACNVHAKLQHIIHSLELPQRPKPYLQTGILFALFFEVHDHIMATTSSEGGEWGNHHSSASDKQ